MYKIYLNCDIPQNFLNINDFNYNSIFYDEEINENDMENELNFLKNFILFDYCKNNIRKRKIINNSKKNVSNNNNKNSLRRDKNNTLLNLFLKGLFKNGLKLNCNKHINNFLSTLTD